MLPADCRGLAGWGRLDLFSDAVSMSNRSLSLARPCDTATLKAVPGSLDLLSLFQTRIPKVGSGLIWCLHNEAANRPVTNTWM